MLSFQRLDVYQRAIEFLALDHGLRLLEAVVAVLTKML
jgi:hypothetical protein